MAFLENLNFKSCLPLAEQWGEKFLNNRSYSHANEFSRDFYGTDILLRKNNLGETSINDVRRFSVNFDLPTYHVRRFLPYNVRYLGDVLAPPPSYPKI